MIPNQSRPETSGKSLIVGSRARAAVLCVAVIASCALAQTNAPKPQPEVNPVAKADRKSEAKPEDRSTRAAGDKAGPKGAKKGKAGCGARQKGAARVELTPNPGARWACDQQTVTLDPVWGWDKNLTFTFDIRNEGTADLVVNAKGG